MAFTVQPAPNKTGLQSSAPDSNPVENQGWLSLYNESDCQGPDVGDWQTILLRRKTRLR